MANITFTIPDEKLSRITEAIKGLYPIPKDEDGNDLYTANAWAKEHIKRTVVNWVLEWETINLSAQKDDSIIS